EADSAFQLPLKIMEKLNLNIIARSEVTVTTFRSHRHMHFAIPHKNRFAESRACGNKATIPDRTRVTFTQNVNLLRMQFCDAISICLQVVDEKEMLNCQFSRQLGAIQYPWQIR